MNYRHKIQQSLKENGEKYTLKSNNQIKNIIIDFGLGKTTFHTADIERLIKEHEYMLKLLITQQKRLERLILLTPSGIIRNELTDENTDLMLLIDELTK